MRFEANIRTLGTNWLQHNNSNGYKRVEIDGNPGVKINISGTKKRLEFEMAIENSQYIVLSKNYMVIIGFSTVGVSQEQTKIEFDKHQILFSLIMNSLIIVNKYE